MKKKNKIRYAKKDILDSDEFEPKYTKFRVTMYIALQTLEKIRDEAKEKGLPYQTYINQLLMEHVSKKDEEKIREIVRDEFRKLG
ncbi:MAG: hypothetical protein HY537_02405 [Deltaproteobacteria bacterium]|nr:hypothetical protein [Deltaproteobacteria bacterium]